MKQQRWAEAEKRKSQKKKSGKRKCHKKADQCVRKSRKVVKHCVLSMFCGSGGSKSRLAKAAGAEPSGEIARCCGAKHISTLISSEGFHFEASYLKFC